MKGDTGIAKHCAILVAEYAHLAPVSSVKVSSEKNAIELMFNVFFGVTSF